MSNKVERDIRKMLARSGVAWEIRQGGKHLKVYVEGHFVCIMSQADGAAESAGGHKNVISKINRAVGHARVRHAGGDGRRNGGSSATA